MDPPVKISKASPITLNSLRKERTGRVTEVFDAQTGLGGLESGSDLIDPNGLTGLGVLRTGLGVRGGLGVWMGLGVRAALGVRTGPSLVEGRPFDKGPSHRR